MPLRPTYQVEDVDLPICSFEMLERVARLRSERHETRLSSGTGLVPLESVVSVLPVMDGLEKLIPRWPSSPRHHATVLFFQGGDQSGRNPCNLLASRVIWREEKWAIVK